VPSTRRATPRRPGARQWWLVVYRVPSEPASRRVAVWRDLKRIGALYLQQCVCILPQSAELGEELVPILAKIGTLGGEYIRFDIPHLDAADEQRIIQAFRKLRSNEYAEIIEECETKFVREIEFEHFRKNYTFEEAEEIAQDLDKIRRWYGRIQSRDWFGADRAQEVADWLERCQDLLVGFEEAVYRQQPSDVSDQDVGLLADALSPRPNASIIRLSQSRARSTRNVPVRSTEDVGSESSG